MFLDALVSILDPTIAHFNKRCVSVTESPAGSTGKPLTIHFQDGTSYDADVVLGADGVKSNVRDFVVGGEGKRLKFSNTVAYRGLINYAELRAAGFKTDLSERPVCFVGPSKVSASVEELHRRELTVTRTQHFILFNIKNAEIVSTTS